ncbi:hypothetical protein LWI28_023079 [Acer negundo]|uniref:PARP1-like PADR1 domain-containing protein n=1 Tax=Acer negundo TaxID=4023 RepID=A0AAD5JMJ4_ACENE|nr:hypothetical protein LWI28_023079 [Acer negundo]
MPWLRSFLLLVQKLRYKEKKCPSSILQKLVQNVEMLGVIKGQKLVRQKWMCQQAWQRLLVFLPTWLMNTLLTWKVNWRSRIKNRGLKKQVTTLELREILEANGQDSTGLELDLLDCCGLNHRKVKTCSSPASTVIPLQPFFKSSSPAASGVSQSSKGEVFVISKSPCPDFQRNPLKNGSKKIEEAGVLVHAKIKKDQVRTFSLAGGWKIPTTVLF